MMDPCGMRCVNCCFSGGNGGLKSIRPYNDGDIAMITYLPVYCFPFLHVTMIDSGFDESMSCTAAFSCTVLDGNESRSDSDICILPPTNDLSCAPLLVSVILLIHSP